MYVERYVGMAENNEQSNTQDYEIKLSKAQIEYAKRAIESANRVLASALPSISHAHTLAKNLPKITTPILESSILSQTSALSAAASNAIKSIIDTDTSSHLQTIIQQQTKVIENLTKSFTKDWFSQISEITKNAQKFVVRGFPPNWTDKQTLYISTANLEVMLLDEGLPLAWVPPHSVMKKLFAASNASERRKILFNNRRSIIKVCLTELKAIDEPKLKEYVDFAIESAESIEAGRWRASQALSTNLIDSMIRRLFDNQSRVELTSQKQQLDWKSYPIRAAVVFGGIWASYSEYWPDGSNGSIPRQFTRHASAHAVSNRQYTKINALIALIHLTAFIKLISEDFIED